ncbi:ABC transporter [Nocardioidaceae bacterium]|nr:ABC transporter [Nocardioidaceae bacterium]
MIPRPAPLLLGAALLLTSACSEPGAGTPAAGATSAPAPAPSPQPSGETSEDATGEDHGAVAGAREVAEPQLQLLSVDASGSVGLLDLLTEETRRLEAVEAPRSISSEGRFAFVTVPGGLTVLDSGTWTWSHGDHSHYYDAQPRLVGTLPGEGPVTLEYTALSTAGATGVFFRRTGEAVLLDHGALAAGRIEERFRVRTTPHDGLLAPLGDGAVVSIPDPDGDVAAVRRLDADGDPVPGSRTRCRDAAGTIITVVGLVVGCADGALLWTGGDGDEDGPDVERIPYPERADAPPAREFTGRKGRPTVSALAGPRAFWLLDTREGTWALRRVEEPMRQVVASDDEDGHVVALGRDGRVRVYSAEDGERVGQSPPLLGGGVDDGGRGDGEVQLTVDRERAYLNAPGRGLVLEIDYADGARVARELRTPTSPAFVVETGR